MAMRKSGGETLREKIFFSPPDERKCICACARAFGCVEVRKILGDRSRTLVVPGPTDMW